MPHASYDIRCPITDGLSLRVSHSITCLQQLVCYNLFLMFTTCCDCAHSMIQIFGLMLLNGALALVVGNFWVVWKFILHWWIDGSDTGWAETLVVELIILWLIHDSQVGNDMTVKVCSDNSSVIGAGNCGHL